MCSGTSLSRLAIWLMPHRIAHPHGPAITMGAPFACFECGWMFVRAKQISNYNGRAFGARMNCSWTLLPVSGGKCGRRGIPDGAHAGLHGEERGPDAESPPDRQQLGSACDGGGCQPHQRCASAKNHR